MKSSSLMLLEKLEILPKMQRRQMSSSARLPIGAGHFRVFGTGQFSCLHALRENGRYKKVYRR